MLMPCAPRRVKSKGTRISIRVVIRTAGFHSCVGHDANNDIRQPRGGVVKSPKIDEQINVSLEKSHDSALLISAALHVY